jgi:hypothetical protein
MKPSELSVIAESSAIGRRIMTAIEKEMGHGKKVSYLPTETARTSIFSPISKIPAVSEDLVFKSSWGKMEVSGPRLNITDESVMLAILHEVRRFKSVIIKLNYQRICELLKIKPVSENRRRIKTAIAKLSKTSVTIELKDGTWSIERILTRARGYESDLFIQVDDFFFKKFLVNEITLIDLNFRQKLRGDVTKALYRFLCSHRGVGRFFLSTLIAALNMDPKQPNFRNRASLKRAFSQLRKKGFLQFQFKDDLFFNIRIDRPKKREAPEKKRKQLKYEPQPKRYPRL